MRLLFLSSATIPLSAKVKPMELDFDYFAELDAYESRAEYEAWLDEQEQEFLATIDDSPYCEEVVE